MKAVEVRDLVKGCGNFRAIKGLLRSKRRGDIRFDGSQGCREDNRTKDHRRAASNNLGLYDGDFAVNTWKV
jgi:hypothetical protein